MIIRHNIVAINTLNQLSNSNQSQMKSMEKLSSGLRINRAGDDAAGLAISEKMRGQIRGLDQANRNAQDGISLIQTAEGALNEVHSILQRMREITVQAANDTNTTDDKNQIQKEIHQLTREISRIGNTTEFNNKALLRGNDNGDVATSASFTFQIGANSGQSLELQIRDMRSLALGLSSEADESSSWGGYPVSGPVGTVYYSSVPIELGSDSTVAGELTLQVNDQPSANSALLIIDHAIKIVSEERGKLGAYQNRLEHTMKNLMTTSENLTASESRIRDVDMAKEMMNHTKQSILSQAGQAMLAQANQTPQGILQLLR
ncbi:flagellin Hag [Metabacillus litoralis]|uniref:flagellin Hag n=1 Tax=Metabacillus litoralis TaxID=152268 RepID=UPI00204208C0|nr:flagellin Hag [Metabacillus litoralis]MCM3162325.1 flagellin Hag [Metabacillus litoralis]